MKSWFDDLEKDEDSELLAEEELDDDEISPREAAFMEGYLEED